jgi:hypothetical protein
MGQRGGAVVIPPIIAHWLGRKLIEASNGDLQEYGCAVTVDKEGKVIEET